MRMSNRPGLMETSAKIVFSMTDHARKNFKDELTPDVILTVGCMLAAASAVRCCPYVSDDERHRLFGDITEVVYRWIDRSQRGHAESN